MKQEAAAQAAIQEGRALRAQARAGASNTLLTGLGQAAMMYGMPAGEDPDALGSAGSVRVGSSSPGTQPLISPGRSWVGV